MLFRSGTSPSWSATVDPQKPSPYVFIFPGTRCAEPDSVGSSSNGGITSWLGSYVPTVPDQHDVENVQHVKSIASEVTLNAVESLSFATRNDVEHLEDDYSTVHGIALSALAASALLLGASLTLCCFRFIDKKRFSEALVYYPLQKALPVSATTTELERMP